MEQIDFTMLFRWFVALRFDTPVWDYSTFTKNRDRLFESDSTRLFFFSKVVKRACRKKFLSDELFTVDGTLIEAWTSMRSFHVKESNDTTCGSFKGGKNYNEPL